MKAAPNPLPSWYAPWFNWIRSGRKGRRPRNAPKRIPAWAFEHFAVDSARLGAATSLSSLEHKATNVIFTAQDPLAARPSSVRYKIALTADSGAWTASDSDRRAVVAEFRSQGRIVYAWGNQSQIPADQIRQLASDYQLDGCIYQAESADEYDTATEAGAMMIVGNPNALTPEQRVHAAKRIRDGLLAWICEVYTNVSHPWPDEYGTQGVPVASWCLGLYDGSGDNPNGGRYVPVAEYRAHTPPADWPRVSVYYAEGVADGDWAQL